LHSKSLEIEGFLVFLEAIVSERVS